MIARNKDVGAPVNTGALFNFNYQLSIAVHQILNTLYQIRNTND